ncbi:hypothetical protein ZTR_11403, partial [Talaromyces verruculosus]
MNPNNQPPGERQPVPIEELLTQLMHRMEALNVDVNTRIEAVNANVDNRMNHLEAGFNHLDQRTANLEIPQTPLAQPPLSPVPQPEVTEEAPRRQLRHQLGHATEYDNSDKSLFLPFLAELQAKINIDGLAIGNIYAQI